MDRHTDRVIPIYHHPGVIMKRMKTFERGN